MSIGFLLIAPVVIGFTTYSMQNSIYFDFETIFVYFLGDCVVIYILTLLAVASVDNQLHSLSKWSQSKLFGNESKYSVVVLEDWFLIKKYWIILLVNQLVAKYR